MAIEAFQFNRHVWDVEPKYFPIQRHYVMAIYSLYTLSAGLIRLSVLLFYRRLSSRAVSPAFRWTMRLTIAIVGICMGLFIFLPIFMCSPISAFWDQTDFTKVATNYKYKCLYEGADVVAAGIISTLQDLVVASLPTLLCWNLQMPFRQKLALYGIFAISYTAVVIGALRTYSVYRLFFQTYDITWVASDAWLCTLLELHIGSMCANVPALKVFFTRYLRDGRLHSRSRSRSKFPFIGSNRQRSIDTDTIVTSAGSVTTLWEKVHLWEKVQSWTRPHPRQAIGYISEPYAQISTDNHGGIIHKNASLDSSNRQRDGMSTPLDSQHDGFATYQGGYNSFDREDIEMGAVPSKTIPDNSELQALPPISPPERARRPRGLYV
ncbi:hypothetical protein N0V83_009933 [Neocucurbitaria cava]|uniref:Rhodopsin domain-containing protein n=1 Tax=Neocucurbitaria cava TaxID=798079 RepID=A0A9W8XZH3_9PLEO|nr:hypothetical protein N0V83_009933 [Neocucurbitaria cava]